MAKKIATELMVVDGKLVRAGRSYEDRGHQAKVKPKISETELAETDAETTAVKVDKPRT